MRTWVRIALFFSSYAPLFVILALLELNSRTLGILTIAENVDVHVLPLVFIIFAGLGVVIAMAIISVTRMQSAVMIQPTKVKRGSEETLAYLVTYLVPFIGFKFTGVNDIIADTILLGVICILYIQSNMIFINPTFNLLGYRVYRVFVEGNEKLMLARREVQEDNRTKAVIVIKGLYIEPKHR